MEVIVLVGDLLRVLPSFVSFGFEGRDTLLQGVIIHHLLQETGVELAESHGQGAFGMHLNQGVEL